MENIKTKKSFLIVGAGGLGCSIAESLIRFGADSITICDGDCFDESNLNRQLYATPKTVGLPKVFAAEERAKELGFSGRFTSFYEFFIKDNADRMLKGIDIVIDALDNIESRLLLEDECAKRKLPIVHGAVSGWIYQLAIAMPGEGLLHKIYSGHEVAAEIPEQKSSAKAPQNPSTFSFMVQLCAARQVAEAVKLANGIDSTLLNSLLICDVLAGDEQLLR